MIYTNIEQLTVGTTFFQERTYSGFVEFKVVSNDGDAVVAKSIGILGFDFEISQSGLDSYNAMGKHAFDTIESARIEEQRKEDERIEGYLETYGEDKDAFVALVLKRAYISAMDAEYGDDVEGLAIKKLASIHYPEVEL